MAGQWGLKTEVTWGTAVTVDKFMPVLRAFPGSGVPEQIRREAITPRRIRKPGKNGAVLVKPSVEFEASNKNGIATILKHMHGGVSTSGSGPYEHTYTFGTPYGDSFTMQTGITDATDTVRPFTAAGCKVDSWTASCAVNENLKIALECSAKSVVTATALATASYADDESFTALEGTLSIAGSPVASTRAFTLSVAKNMSNERLALGSASIREQLENGYYDITLSVEADFEGLDLYAAAVDRDQVAIEIPFVSGGAGAETLTWTMSGQIIGDPPELSSPGLQTQTLNLEISHGTADASAYTLVLENSESSAA